MKNTRDDMINRRDFLNKISKIGIATLATPYLIRKSFSENTDKKTILIVGDSTTANQQLGYSEILKAYIGDLTNVNVQGIGNAPDGSGIESWDIMGYGISIFENIKKINPDIFQMNQGHHCLSWIDKLSEEEKMFRLETFKKNLKIYLNKIKTEMPGCKFIWATSLPTDECAAPNEKPDLGCKRKNENVIVYNQAAMEICNSENIVINDLYAFAINNNLKRISDGTHYTVESNSLIGKNVAEFLTPYINNSSIKKWNYQKYKNGNNIKYLYQDNMYVNMHVNASKINSVNAFNIAGKKIDVKYQFNGSHLKIMKKNLSNGFYKVLIKVEETVNEIHFIAH